MVLEHYRDFFRELNKVRDSGQTPFPVIGTKHLLLDSAESNPEVPEGVLQLRVTKCVQEGKRRVLKGVVDLEWEGEERQAGLGYCTDEGVFEGTACLDAGGKGGLRALGQSVAVLSLFRKKFFKDVLVGSVGVRLDALEHRCVLAFSGQVEYKGDAIRVAGEVRVRRAWGEPKAEFPVFFIEQSYPRFDLESETRRAQELTEKHPLVVRGGSGKPGTSRPSGTSCPTEPSDPWSPLGPIHSFDPRAPLLTPTTPAPRNPADSAGPSGPRSALLSLLRGQLTEAQRLQAEEDRRASPEWRYPLLDRHERAHLRSVLAKHSLDPDFEEYELTCFSVGFLEDFAAEAQMQRRQCEERGGAEEEAAQLAVRAEETLAGVESLMETGSLAAEEHRGRLASFLLVEDLLIEAFQRVDAQKSLTFVRNRRRAIERELRKLEEG